MVHRFFPALSCSCSRWVVNPVKLYAKCVCSHILCTFLRCSHLPLASGRGPLQQKRSGDMTQASADFFRTVFLGPFLVNQLHWWLPIFRKGLWLATSFHLAIIKQIPQFHTVGENSYVQSIKIFSVTKMEKYFFHCTSIRLKTTSLKKKIYEKLGKLFKSRRVLGNFLVKKKEHSPFQAAVGLRVNFTQSEM